jgi:hypothetical protein
MSSEKKEFDEKPFKKPADESRTDGEIAEIAEVSPATASRRGAIFVKGAMIEATPPFGSEPAHDHKNVMFIWLVPKNVVFSIQIPAMHGKYLQEVLESIRSQSLQEYEVVVVNSGGDEISDLIREFGFREIRRRAGLLEARYLANSESVIPLSASSAFNASGFSVLLASVERPLL